MYLGLPGKRHTLAGLKIFSYICNVKRNIWKYLPKKEKFSVLFNNDDDKAKLLYNSDMVFKDFVLNWDKENPALLGWSLADFYRAYTTKEPTIF